MKRVCMDCGAEFEGTPKSRYCDACRRERVLETKRKNARLQRIAEGNRECERLDPGGSAIGRGITHTVEEAAEYFGVSRQAIVNIERRAFLKIRKFLAGIGIRSSKDL